MATAQTDFLTLSAGLSRNTSPGDSLSAGVNPVITIATTSRYYNCIELGLEVSATRLTGRRDINYAVPGTAKTAQATYRLTYAGVAASAILAVNYVAVFKSVDLYAGPRIGWVYAANTGKTRTRYTGGQEIIIKETMANGNGYVLGGALGCRVSLSKFAAIGAEVSPRVLGIKYNSATGNDRTNIVQMPIQLTLSLQY